MRHTWLENALAMRRKIFAHIRSTLSPVISTAHIETLAILALAAVTVAATLNRGIAEISAILLPVILILGIIGRKWSHPQTPRLEPSATSETGQTARSALEATLHHIGPAKSRACIFVRIDDHLHLSQRWGRSERDEILRRTDERLRATLRASDMVSDLGDGTFGIVLKSAIAGRPDYVDKVVDRISRSLSEPIPVAGSTALVTVSQGVAVSGPDLAIRDLVASAESALVEAQKHGLGTTCRFSRDLKDRLDRDRELARTVDDALASGELRAWFQPQICADTAKITGFEALARWHHPKFGLLSPAQFLGVLADTGKLPRLGEEMLKQALSALASWDRKGRDIPCVSVNFSPEELRDPGLAERVKWEVDRFDIEPNRLVVEILESVAALSQDDVILRNIDQFASHGFLLDLDDFGTGQASIQNIRRFQIQRVKIDRSFVTGVNKDPKQQATVAAILSLAQHVNVATIAEGVETSAEFSILAQLGCDEVQGYGVARPMPFDETFAWIDSHRARTACLPDMSRKTG